MGRRLGKLPRRQDRRVPVLSAFCRAGQLAALPDAVDWARGVVSWPMMGNDRLGDCTAAALGHAVQLWTTHAQAPAVLTDEQVVAVYRATGGYVPGDPVTDRGAVCSEVLAWWVSRGLWVNPQRLEILTAYAVLEHAATWQVKASLAWLGGVYAGLALPLTAQDQTMWDLPPASSGEAGLPGSWGGHCVLLAGYDPAGLICVTWGGVQRMSWAFWARYADEAYALLSRDWLDTRGISPEGLDIDGLQAAMAAVREA